VGVNADTLQILKRLSTDRPLRESMVAAAQDYAREQATSTASPSPEKPVAGGSDTEPAKTKSAGEPKPAATETPQTDTSSSPSGQTTLGSTNDAVRKSEDTGSANTNNTNQAPSTPPKTEKTPPKTEATPTPSPAGGAKGAKSDACVADLNSAQCAHELALGKIPACAQDASSADCAHEFMVSKIPACATDRNSTECRIEERLLKIPSCYDLKGTDPVRKNSPQCNYEASLARIDLLGLPVGWDTPGSKFPGWNLKLWWEATKTHFPGWLLTALAISLGAPFWFDLLNKFIVVRSAVKPHEKSPEEGSKD
jgi:hypothetical protein